ncbi:hypothetical protein FOIG_10851 [Fusarium odoratissimum NRRL 54006]|uniref:Uncharacterized protein n=2 Tax=Fusarium oxysporum species complex TaxID=171631 RepID=X0KJZ3_FUSO5|nr:uncharacterized protein FOIG_10851 [Fusarium odoratissimum NRRL 54006]EXL97189.1 hypothetical protein FOIG_10851 [Fusarium odoratissimum NRRL 54006]TXC00898.1 hypothetical protein FocTR4_00009076 [Fusarium oxysporum f. sp. cubense]
MRPLAPEIQNCHSKENPHGEMHVVSWYVQLACVADPQSVHHNCQRWFNCVLKWNALCLGQIDPANFVQEDLELFQEGKVAVSRVCNANHISSFPPLNESAPQVLYRYGLCVTETETLHSGHAVLDGKLISSNEI